MKELVELSFNQYWLVFNLLSLTIAGMLYHSMLFGSLILVFLPSGG